MQLFQWILSFIEMANVITIRSKIRQTITSTFIDEYNSLHNSEEDRIKGPQEDMQIAVTADEIEVEMFTTKGAKGITAKGQKAKFTLHDDESLYAYSTEFQSLIFYADQHRDLPILKLRQAVILTSTNKLQRKYTFGIHSEEFNFKLYVPMYFEVFEDLCEYLTWSISHSANTLKPPKSYERFYQNNAKKVVPSDFALLEVGIDNLSLGILFSESLVYLLHFEDVTNVPNCPFNTPLVCFFYFFEATELKKTRTRNQTKTFCDRT